MIILLGIVYWGYKFVNNTSSLIGVVHKNADAVVKIDLHGIKETLVLDALSAPKFYYDNISFSSSKKEKDSTVEKGINLKPYTAVLYTLKNVKNTIFTTLPIENTADFNAYVKEYVTKKKGVIQIAEGYTYAVLEKSKVSIAWNTKNLAIAAAPDKIDISKITAVFKDVLVDEKLITDKSNSLIQKLKSIKDHIAYVKGASVIGLNFEDGKLAVAGQLEVDKSSVFSNEIIVNSLPDASLQMYIDYSFADDNHKKDFISTFKNSSFLQKSNLQVDSIAKYSTGFFSLAIDGKTKQQDTIITYAYDDNFNKVEEKTVQEKEAPKMFVNLGVNKDGFPAYLQTQGTIEQGVFTALPIYNFYVSSTATTSLFATAKKAPKTEVFKSANFLDITANFSKLNRDISFPKSGVLFGLLNTLDVKANLVKQGVVGLEGSLSAKREDINIITQLFFGLENAK
ncbi:hypothetical protein M4I21_11690 [Cellulophaga sp. 20_2_10]|uniref:hypothetical protein n=1 Tax=Cellulophaga sp. 20_2_10 TaxID=2942476 RepID=UPI00201A5366|nr:hypothetical protein [Cellulophaga sp. 20_2_10]MCL5246476.1 hypothetical protein [Cellulophaga sp. 20_2_10]